MTDKPTDIGISGNALTMPADTRPATEAATQPSTLPAAATNPANEKH